MTQIGGSKAREITRAAGPGFLLLLLLWGVSSQIAWAQTPEFYRAQAEQRLQAELARLQALPETAANLAERAHARFFLGSVTPDPDAALTHFRFGQSRAAAALELQQDQAEARLWYVVNTLRIFGLTRPFSALWKMGDLEAQLLALRDEDPGFLFAAPDRVLAVLYSEAPGFLLGSSKKAERHFRRALELAPGFPANTLLYAAFLVEQEKPEQARKLLENWSGESELARYPLYEMIWRRDLALLRESPGI